MDSRRLFRCHSKRRDQQISFEFSDFCHSRFVEAECDIWILDVERSPFAWQEAMNETMTQLPPATINLSQ